MSRTWIIVVGVLCLLLAAFVAGGPFLTMRGIERAADKRDEDLLDRHVNFSVLRENLRPQVRGAVERKLEKKAKDNPLAALATAYSDKIADRLVDEIITPQGIARLLEGEDWRQKKKRKKTKLKGRVQTIDDDSDEPRHSWRYVSASEFQMNITRRDKLTVFVLSREGLVWRLTNIQLPAKIAAPATGA